MSDLDRLMRLLNGKEESTDKPTLELDPALFEDIYTFLRRYVVLSQHESVAVSLWVLMTYVTDTTDCVPYLAINSPEKGSGKTRLLEVLSMLVLRPWMTGRTTAAVLARKIDKEHPTLLLDESDAAFSGDKDYSEVLRGVLNTGYLRSGKTSICVNRGKTIDYVDLSTFGPKAIAGIGTLPDTVADRSIPIRLARKLPSETTERFRRKRVEPEAAILRDHLVRWADVYIAEEHSEPAGLDTLASDRASEIWEPLLAIAEAFDSALAEKARQASAALSGAGREDASLGTQLLVDIQRIFAETGDDRMSSADLAKRLGEVEESPWGPFHGRDFDNRALARKLKPYGVKPKTIRIGRPDEHGKDTARGYHVADFKDAWARYCPQQDPPPEKPSQPSQTSQPNKIKLFRGHSSVTNGAAESNTSDTNAENTGRTKDTRDGERVNTADASRYASYPSQECDLSQKSAKIPHEIQHVTDVTDVTSLADGFQLKDDRIRIFRESDAPKTDRQPEPRLKQLEGVLSPHGMMCEVCGRIGLCYVRENVRICQECAA